MTTLTGNATLDPPSRDGSGRDRERYATPGTVALALHALSTWRERARQRRALLTLSDAMLRDIGISRCDACGEGWKPFWQA